MVLSPSAFSSPRDAPPTPPVRPPRPPSLSAVSPTRPPPQPPLPVQSPPASMTPPVQTPQHNSQNHHDVQVHQQAHDRGYIGHSSNDRDTDGDGIDAVRKEGEDHVVLRFASHLLPSPPNAPPPVPPLLPFGNITAITASGTGITFSGSSDYGANTVTSQGNNPAVSGYNKTSGDGGHGDKAIQHSGTAGTGDGLALDLESATALFSHAVLLFHAYCWHQSLKLHRSMLRRGLAFSGAGNDIVSGRSGDPAPYPGHRDGSSLANPKKTPLPKTSHLWFNIGVIRCHLGEYALAVEALDRAVEDDQRLAVAWFVMGMALFELQDFRRAERRFKMALLCFDDAAEGSQNARGNSGDESDSKASGNAGNDYKQSSGRKLRTMQLDYRPQGLNFVLERTRVEFNVRLSLLWKLHRQVNAERPPPWSLNRLPAGRIFEAVDHSVNSTDSGVGVGRINSLSEMEDKKDIVPVSPRKTVRFANPRSAPVPPPPPKPQPPPPGRSLPARLPKKFFPILLRRRKSDKEKQPSTSANTITAKNDDGSDRALGTKTSPLTVQTKVKVEGRTAAIRTTDNEATTGKRIDSFAIIASSTHDRDAHHKKENQPGYISVNGPGPGPWNFKPLPPVPGREAASGPASLPEPSPLRDGFGTDHMRMQPSPGPRDSFIAARRQSAFAMLDTARPPGRAKVPDMVTMLKVLRAETEDDDVQEAVVRDDKAPKTEAHTKKKMAVAASKTATTAIRAPAGVTPVAKAAGAGASPVNREIGKPKHGDVATNNGDQDKRKHGRTMLDSVQIFSLGRQQGQPQQQVPRLPAPQKPKLPPRAPQGPPRPWP